MDPRIGSLWGTKICQLRLAGFYLVNCENCHFGKPGGRLGSDGLHRQNCKGTTMIDVLSLLFGFDWLDIASHEFNLTTQHWIQSSVHKLLGLVLHTRSRIQFKMTYFLDTWRCDQTFLVTALLLWTFQKVMIWQPKIRMLSFLLGKSQHSNWCSQHTQRSSKLQGLQLCIIRCLLLKKTFRMGGGWSKKYDLLAWKTAWYCLISIEWMALGFPMQTLCQWRICLWQTV
jgi:hypothetical protein